MIFFTPSLEPGGTHMLHYHLHDVGGCPQVPVESFDLTSAPRALLHRVCTDNAFTRKTKPFVQLTDSSACPSCGAGEDLSQALWDCGAHKRHIRQRGEMYRILHAANRHCQCLGDAIFPIDSTQSANVAFVPLLK